MAVIANSLTPYRVHYHRRIARELPEIESFTLLTHGESNSPWVLTPPPEINLVEFGSGERSSGQSRLRHAPNEWRKGGRIVRWLATHGIRAVVLGGYNDLGRLRILRWCRRRGVPCFLFGDSNVRSDHHGRLKSAVLPTILSWCAGVMPCGTLGQEYFVRYGVPRDRMFLTPYEPDYDQISGISVGEIDRVRERFGFNPSRRTLLYSGRLVPVKRVDLLLDAFAAVAPARPEWDLAILGDGPLADELRSRIPSNLADRVRWLGFVNDQATVAAICRACQVLVLPSDAEPWAVVVNEAVAAGMAIVASDAVGAAADLVRDGVNGRVFPRGNLNALSDCLLDVSALDRATILGAASADLLADWRRSADPVEGLRSALRFAGVLPRQPVE